METASLRIKFKPLLQDICKGESTCLLEIVPEVSAIQSLDKLQWKMDQTQVEYNIPMTYKLIIKKQKSSRDKNGSLDKVYYSCVDLLHTYSFTNDDSACGDATRMISDSFILGKITTNSIEKCNVKQIKGITREPKEINDTEQNTSTYSIHTIEINDLENTNKFLDADHKKCNVITSTSAVSQNVTSAYIQVDFNVNDAVDPINTTVDKIDQTITRAYRNKRKYKSILSLSPILSVNTYDYTTAKKSQTSTDLCVYEIKDDDAVKISSCSCELDKNICDVYDKSFNADRSLINNYSKTTITRLLGDVVSCSDSTITRLHPEERVASFVRMMEIEIFPLKLLLNEIRNKCVSLGLLFYKGTSEQNSLLYKNMPKLVDNQWNRRNRIKKSCRTQATDYDNQKNCDAILPQSSKRQKNEHQGYILSKSPKYMDARVKNYEKDQNSRNVRMNCCKSDKSANRVVYSFVFDD